jgi:bacillithiol system protein YtxJ
MLVNNEKESSNKFIHLTSHNQLAEIDRLSADRYVYVMKHSSRCGISFAALEHYEQFAEYGHDIHIYLLDLITYRDVSNAIADRYGVPHSSPQVLVIRDGKSVRHATHYSIDVHWLNTANIPPS